MSEQQPGKSDRLSLASAASNLPSPVRPHSELHPVTLLKALVKRRGTVLTVFALIMGLALVDTYTAVPIYEARATLLIEVENPNVVSFKDIIEQERATSEFFQTQVRILQSRTIARRALEKLNLWEHPEFGGGPPKQTARSWMRSTVSSVTGLFFSAPATQPAAGSTEPPPIPPGGENPRHSGRIDAFVGRLNVTPARASRVVDVKFRASEPEIAQRAANAVAEAYIQQNLEFRFKTSEQATAWLAAQLKEQRDKVEQSETAMQRYKEQNDSVSLTERENIVVQKLTDLNSALTRAKAERISKQTFYDQLRGMQNDRAALESFPAILSNAYIQQLRIDLGNFQRQLALKSETLGDRHSEIIAIKQNIQIGQAKLDAEIAKVTQSIRSEYLAAKAEEDGLAAALEEQKRQAYALNSRGVAFGVLERDAAANRQIYESLLQRTKETGIAKEMPTSNVRVVDSAELPRGPILPQRRRDLTLGFALGLLLGCGLALVFEYFDNRIKRPEQLTVDLGLAFLGMVPIARQREGQPLLTQKVPAVFAEAFRLIRTNLLFSTAEEGMRTLVVTSTGPGEGKTMVSVNLAVSLAHAGQRVLLVDADLRLPRTHVMFEIPQEPGLSNLLVGNAKASEAVRRTTTNNLWILPAGRVPPNPAELVGSQRFRDFCTSLEEHFDWVVIDSPPVMPVADASVIAQVATGVLFVVGSEMTSRGAAKAAIERLEKVHAPIVGAVLNKVDLTRDSYYYSEYYRPNYGKYYHAVATSAPVAPPTVETT